MSYTSLTFLVFGVALLWSAVAVKLVGASHVRDESTPASPVGPPADEWRERQASDLSAAECLLDWLEAEGFADREFTTQPDGTFAVRWRRGAEVLSGGHPPDKTWDRN